MNRQITRNYKKCISARLLSTTKTHFVSATQLISKEKETPYTDLISKIKSPIKYLKWKVNMIDESINIYERCSLCTRQDLISELKLKDNLNTWFAITILHVWIVNTRLRAEGLIGKELKQEVFNNLCTDIEIRLSKAGLKTKLAKTMEDLLDSYYGQSLSYDEGLSKGDAIFASALWRNFFFSEPNVLPSQLLALLTYTRANLIHVSNMDRLEFLKGKFEFLDFSKCVN